MSELPRRRLPEGLLPRLLSREAAAAYLGVSVNHFDRHVATEVAAVLIGQRRLWDLRALDRWLDLKSGLVEPFAPADEWLEALDGDPVGRG